MCTAKDMEFTGTVFFRSSKEQGGVPGEAPGEAEIQRKNPQRKKMILNATGWDDLFPGSLNIRVDRQVVHRLLLCEPLIREPGETITYPEGYKHIPKMRVGYLYYKAVLTRKGNNEEVLVRRACNTKYLEDIIEVFAPKNLKDAMSLNDGDQITCRIVSLRNH